MTNICMILSKRWLSKTILIAYCGGEKPKQKYKQKYHLNEEGYKRSASVMRSLRCLGEQLK